MQPCWRRFWSGVIAGLSSRKAIWEFKLDGCWLSRRETAIIAQGGVR